MHVRYFDCSICLGGLLLFVIFVLYADGMIDALQSIAVAVILSPLGTTIINIDLGLKLRDMELYCLELFGLIGFLRDAPVFQSCLIRF